MTSPNPLDLEAEMNKIINQQRKVERDRRKVLEICQKCPNSVAYIVTMWEGRATRTKPAALCWPCIKKRWGAFPRYTSTRLYAHARKKSTINIVKKALVSTRHNAKEIINGAPKVKEISKNIKANADLALYTLETPPRPENF